MPTASKKPRTKRLPRKLSRLILVALEDLEKVERSKRYVVDMKLFHVPIDGVCHVCFAGGVMAMRLGCSPQTFQSEAFEEMDIETARKLFALNYARTGKFQFAAGELGFSYEVIPDSDITPYESNPAQFKADMRSAAAMLAARGL